MVEQKNAELFDLEGFFNENFLDLLPPWSRTQGLQRLWMCSCVATHARTFPADVEDGKVHAIRWIFW